MGTEKKYAVITYFIGNDTGNGVEVEVVERLGKLLTCAICNTSIDAIEEFESTVNMLRGNKRLVDCMKSYYRSSDDVCRDMFLYTEIDKKNISLCRVSIILAGEHQ